MLNIGLGEIVLVMLVLLVFVGPERLPGVLRWLGHHYGKLRRATNELQQAFMDEAEMLEHLKKPMDSKATSWLKPPPAAAAAPTREPVTAEAPASGSTDEGGADA